MYMGNSKKIVLSGMRPTGKLHIGHIEGVLSEWKKLEKEFETFYFVADWHALTTNTNSKKLKEDSIDMVKDWLAYGISEKSTIFLQSQVPQHGELSTILSMLTNIGKLERIPTFKDYLIQTNSNRGSASLGFLNYPVLQSADILLYKTSKVPVGEDQLPHLELTRNLAKKFNKTYGSVFTIPEPILSKSPKVLGFDGRKMSKSYNNTINPLDNKETLIEKVKKIKTDSEKINSDSYGNPSNCQVYDLQKIFSKDLEIVTLECEKGMRSCYDCKKDLVDKISLQYQEFNYNRSNISDEQVINILKSGSQKAKEIANETMNEIKKVMKIKYW